jgi:hypothetical protein
MWTHHFTGVSFVHGKGMTPRSVNLRLACLTLSNNAQSRMEGEDGNERINARL